MRFRALPKPSACDFFGCGRLYTTGGSFELRLAPSDSDSDDSKALSSCWTSAGGGVGDCIALWHSMGMPCVVP